MQYFKAMQRTDGKWDYTVTWDKATHPVGYCHAWREWTENVQVMSPDQYATALANQHKYHNHGHDTAEEACACYKEYQLDQHLQLGLENEGVQHRCLICNDWTSKVARVGRWGALALCDKHNNREEVAKLYEVGESMES
jgi:hypothetical protein